MTEDIKENLDNWRHKTILVLNKAKNSGIWYKWSSFASITFLCVCHVLYDFFTWPILPYLLLWSHTLFSPICPHLLSCSNIDLLAAPQTHQFTFYLNVVILAANSPGMLILKKYSWLNFSLPIGLYSYVILSERPSLITSGHSLTLLGFILFRANVTIWNYILNSLFICLLSGLTRK